MRIHLPNGAPATRVRIDGKYLIVGGDQNVYVYEIGEKSMDQLGVLTAFQGDGLDHVQIVDNRYLVVFQDGSWVFRDCTDGLPVNHTLDVSDAAPVRIDKHKDPPRDDAYIVGVGRPLVNTKGIETFVYLMQDKTIVSRHLCDNGKFINFDDTGSIVYFDKTGGMLMVWKFGYDPMPIDVQSMLMRSSDVITPDEEQYCVRQHNGAIRFITLEGYRGAIEINTFSRVCKVVWPQLYVSEIITYGVTDKCITYDGRSNRFYQQDNDVSDAVNAIISSAMKDITKTYRINYAIDYPEHVAITCGDGSMQMLRVAPR